MLKQQIVASVLKTLNINRGFDDLGNDSLALMIVEQLQSEGCFADEVHYDETECERALDRQEFEDIVKHLEP